MDQSSNVSVAAPRGHTYGDASVDGNATVIFGDVHVNNQTAASEFDSNRRRRRRERLESRQRIALYNALSYEGMDYRSEQLSLPEVPLQSFEWIWGTEFASWLAGDESLFWVTGKPGSGKSTLVQHLTKSNRTRKILNGNNHRYTILSFFFDYRAGSKTANDSLGVIKMFLTQLCRYDTELERELAKRNAEAYIGTADISTLMELFAELSRLLGSKICAFVDGLDEYHGHYTDLGNILAGIQDRSGMKLCVASRPELAFQELFDGNPSIRIQDYNAASVRTYIDHAIRKGRETMARVDTVFDENMREQLQQRAQGVIIWARLAVDELLRAAYLDTSKQTLEEILENLPDELEAMYERSISHMRHSNTMEAALVLFLLNEFGGSLDINLLWGMWDFISSHISVQVIPVHSIIDGGSFVNRMITLIGPFVDILFDSNEIRLMHKTLQRYLRRAGWIQNQLPRCFTCRYPDNLELRMYADVIEAATKADVITLDKILLGYPHWVGSIDTGPYVPVSVLNSYDEWGVRWRFLSYSVARFVDEACALEKSGVSSFGMFRNAMSSYLLLKDDDLLNYFTSWHRAHRCGFLDLVIAVKRSLYGYANERLTDELLLDDRDWSELFCKAIFDPIMLDLLRPYCSTIQTNFLIECGKVSQEWHSADPFEYLIPMLSEMRLPPPVRRFPLLCENDSCGKGDDLIHWWTRTCGDGRLSGTILRLILKSGESVNTRCKQSGTALHILINECLYNKRYSEHSRGGYAIPKLATLARLGIDPTIEHQGRTPLQLAQGVERKLGRSSLFGSHKTPDPEYNRNLALIVLGLKQYNDEKRWPMWVLNAGIIPGWQEDSSLDLSNGVQ